MQINLHTLIRKLLLTFTRDIKIVELIRVLTTQAEKAFNDFNMQVPDWMYKLNANASVLSLQHHIKRELDVDAVITELDGKPIDFLVTVTGFVDESKLSNLINTYKLSGKSFIFENSELTYYCSFINHACEKSLTDNLLSLTISQSTGNLLVSSQFAVTSDLLITVKCWDSPGISTNVTATLLDGATSVDLGQNGQPRLFNQIASLSIEADNTYRYSYNNSIING